MIPLNQLNSDRLTGDHRQLNVVKNIFNGVFTPPPTHAPTHAPTPPPIQAQPDTTKKTSSNTNPAWKYIAVNAIVFFAVALIHVSNRFPDVNIYLIYIGEAIIGSIVSWFILKLLTQSRPAAPAASNMALKPSTERSPGLT